MRVEQRTNSDCGICSLAMSLNISYEEIVGSWCNDIAGLGVTAQETVTYLFRRGYMPVLIQTAEALADVDPSSPARFLTKEKDLIDILVDQPAILTVKTVSGGLRAVFWDGEEVYDPAPTKPSLCRFQHIKFLKRFFCARLLSDSPESKKSNENYTRCQACYLVPDPKQLSDRLSAFRAD